MLSLYVFVTLNQGFLSVLNPSKSLEVCSAIFQTWKMEKMSEKKSKDLIFLFKATTSAL